MLDTESLNLLQKQAQKLESLAASIEEWHRGPYGKLLRFCDTTTFARGGPAVEVLCTHLFPWESLSGATGAAES